MANLQCKLLKDPDEALVDELAAALGLRKIGFIWTALKVDEKKQIIPDRDEDVVLRSAECVRMANLQNKYPSPSTESESGVFGSKFVSVMVHGTKDANIEVSAYQISNQVCRLVKAGAVKVSKQENSLRVSKGDSDVSFPEVFYRAKNEYGLFENFKSNPDFPIEYAIVMLRHSFPKDPTPRFTSTVDFPIENRSINTVNPISVLKAVTATQGGSFWRSLNDFHMLYHLKKIAEKPELLAAVIEGIADPNLGTEPNVRHALDSLVKKSSPTVSLTALSFSHRQSNPSAANTEHFSADSAEAKMMLELMQMGFGEKQVKEALFATNYTSTQTAAEYILSQ